MLSRPSVTDDGGVLSLLECSLSSSAGFDVEGCWLGGSAEKQKFQNQSWFPSFSSAFYLTVV